MPTSAPLLTFSQAKARLLEQLPKKLATHTIGISDALHKITAKDIISPINVPSFNNSAMDGYAVRLSEIKMQQPLNVAGTIYAGQQELPYWPKNSCLRVMTGAPVPDEADAVVMQEQTQQSNGQITFLQPIKPQQNIRYIGEDIKKGEIVVNSGQKLTIPHIARLAALGISQIEVYRPLKVALFSTGDELRDIGNSLSAGKIYDINRLTLKLMLQQLGCQVLDFGIVADDPSQIQQTFAEAIQAEMIITSGGVSVGEADFTKQVLESIGKVQFWKIAMKPGKPFTYGHLNNAIYCGLPGNPISAMVTFYQLVQPLILSLSGLTDTKPTLPNFQVKTISAINKKPGRIDFQRGYLFADENGELKVIIASNQGSHMTQSFNHANCFIVLEQERGKIAAGEYVTVEVFNSLLN
jgi:molybdopterin molybdotransferase